VRVMRLMAYSLFRAAVADRITRAYAKTHGPRDRVYLAPVPALCLASRFGRSFVIPVYSVPSTHRRIYTFHLGIVGTILQVNMKPTTPITPKLAWRPEYSVGVKDLDDQHKELIRIMNEVMTCINNVPSEKRISAITDHLVAYKKDHFATEEMYFEKFKFSGGKAHTMAHKAFDAQVNAMKKEHADDPIAFAFSLVDFLEDWLLIHLDKMDHQYTKCFNDHGLT